MIIKLLKTGYRLAGYHDKRLIKGLVLSAAEGALLTFSYLLIILLMDDVFHQKLTYLTMVSYLAGMIVCLSLRIVLSRHALSCVFVGTYSMMAEARIRVIDHLQKLPLSWFSKARTGDISTRLTSDLELVEGLWSHLLGLFTSSFASILFLLGILCWIDFSLAAIVIATLPLAFWVLGLSQKVISLYDEKMLSSSRKAQAEMYDYVQGIATIRTYGRFGLAWKTLSFALYRQYRDHLTLESKPAALVGAFGFVSEMSFILLLVAGSYKLAVDTLEADKLIMFIFLSLAVYRQLQTLGGGLIKLRFTSRALERIDSLLKEPLPSDDGILTAKEITELPDITFNHVSFTYPGEPEEVLHDISFTIPACSLCAIVGPSGSGKSTLLQMMTRVWVPNGGDIYLGLQPIRDLAQDEVNGLTSMVFQDVVLFSVSVFENIRMGNSNATREQVINAAKIAKATEFIERLPQGYDTILGDNGYSLSGGERQRLSIARAILKKSRILLLDEATSSVDPTTELAIQLELEQLAAQCTIVTVAHRLNTIQHADKILVIDKGRLVEEGTHAALLAQNGLYSRLWEHQERSLSWHL